MKRWYRSPAAAIRRQAMTAAPPAHLSAGRAASMIAALLVLTPAAATIGGCARQSRVGAESREVRLTQDGLFKSGPRFSPDGRSIAFARRAGDGRAKIGVYVMPAAGGDARRISPDTLDVQPMRWSGDGQSVFCVSLDGKTLYRIGLDRSLRVVDHAGAMARFADVTADGNTRLVVAFNKDNHDLGVRRAGARSETLDPTPEWEQGGVFGPGPDQVTAVLSPAFQSPHSTMAVRSLATRAVKPLALPEGMNFSPAWSPDGQQLAYVVSGNGQLDVWLYDPATARSVPAIQDAEDSSSPAWSPDGEWLAFCRSVKTSRLFLGEPGAPDRRQLTRGPANDYDPCVSPDGKWIAFLRRPAPGTEGAGKPFLCVMPVAGGQPIEVDLKGRSLPGKGSEVTWSWDSEHLAFGAREAASGLDIYRVRRDGTGLMRVTVEAGDEIDPRWSPDGRQLSYTRVGGGKTQVAVLPSNGGVSRVLSDERMVSEGGAWSPDGKELAYLTVRQDGMYELWITSPSAPERRRLAFSSAGLAWPVRWAADGQHLILVRGSGQDWYFSELDPASGSERRIASEIMLPGGAGMYIKFLPEGERYRSLLCPGGTIMADGQQTADLYRIRVRDLLKSRLLSAGGQGFSWFARASWVESY